MGGISTFVDERDSIVGKALQIFRQDDFKPMPAMIMNSDIVNHKLDFLHCHPKMELSP